MPRWVRSRRGCIERGRTCGECLRHWLPPAKGVLSQHGTAKRTRTARSSAAMGGPAGSTCARASHLWRAAVVSMAAPRLDSHTRAGGRAAPADAMVRLDFFVPGLVVRSARVVLLRLPTCKGAETQSGFGITICPSLNRDH